MPGALAAALIVATAPAGCQSPAPPPPAPTAARAALLEHIDAVRAGRSTEIAVDAAGVCDADLALLAEATALESLRLP